MSEEIPERISRMVILKGVVGSTCHGTSIDGQDDRDEMGIFVEYPENVFGFTNMDHYTYRSQPDGVRSQPGDLDLVLYSLRRFCRLAASGNPTVLLLMWLPEYIVKTEVGVNLVWIRESFVSKESGKRFLGYLVSQKQRLLGERSHNVSRPELVEKFGFDTKFAMHALRLGLQGIELLRTENITLPIKAPQRQLLLDVRQGKFTFDQSMKMIEDTERELYEEVQKSTRVADIVKIERFIGDAHFNQWNMFAH